MVFEYRLDYPIYAAAVAPNGACAVATAATGDQSQVTVFDSNYTRQFKWVSSERIIYHLALDNTAQYLAVGSVGLNNGALDSVVTVFEVATGRECGAQTLDNALLLGLKLLNGGEVTAVTDRSVYRYSSNSQKSQIYSYQEAHLSAFVIDDDGSAALVLGDYNVAHEQTLIRLDANASPVAQTRFDRNIKSLHSYGEELLAFLGDRTVRFSSTFERLGSTETPEAVCIQIIGKKLYYATMQQLNQTAIR